jgi:diacylglycerol O-acyltransferase / wax synthase
VATLNRRLSAADSIFLYWEDDSQPMHLGECLVYDGQFDRDDVLRMLRGRMHLLPRYRQRVVVPPLRVAHPTWEDDPDFDLENHVDELTLPPPGDDRVLSEFGGRLMSQRLDRNRPLWHVSVLHGHEAGHTVLFLKLHHAMVDGVSSVELLEVLHDVEPPAPVEVWQPRQTPNALSQVASATRHNLSSVVSGGRDLLQLARPQAAKRQIKQLGTLGRTVAESTAIIAKPPPKTPFNKSISGARQFAWLELPFEDVRELKNTLGGTLNDVVLTILSGAVGRYMRRHGYDTDGVALRAMCPVSMRRETDRGGMGNLVSLVVVPLHVGIDDGVERLRAEREAMESLKRRDQAGGMFDAMRWSNRTPAPLHHVLWRWWPKSSWPLNIVSTNVPGPRSPLFLEGHEMLHWYPLGIPWTSLGLFLCTLSYREHLVLGLVVDPEVVPDVWDVIEDLRETYADLRDSAGLPAAAHVTAASATHSERT